MKKILISLLCLLVVSGSNVMAQNPGINFLADKNWKEILAMAKAENKLIFVDVYTDWCGPCKQMDAEVFPKKSIGDKFNASFINYKLDAEKGEGPVVSKQYLVKSYPNYLFINGDGVLIYRSTSSMSPMEFLQVADNALLEAKQEQTIVQLDLLYPANKKDKEFMYKYVLRRTVLRLENTDLLDEYITLLNENERGEIKTLQLILDNGMYIAKNVQLGIALETLKQHKDKFPQLTQKYGESISQIANTAIATSLRKAIAAKDEKLLAKVLSLKADQSKSEFDNKQNTMLAYYLGTGQNEKYFKAAKSYADFLLKLSLTDFLERDARQLESFKKYLAEKNIKGDSEEDIQDQKHTQSIRLSNALLDLSKVIVEQSKDQERLKIALKWIERSLEITKSDPVYFKNVIPFYTETYATIVYKLGNKKLAISSLENMLSSFNNKKADIYFAPLLTKMKANETL